MESLEDVFSCERALVYGIGGGGDVVGTVPTARLLEDHGVDTVIGGVPWERAVLDPTPGPYGLDEIEGIERVSETVALADGETQSRDGVRFAESNVAAHYGERVALVDVRDGPGAVAAGLTAAADALDLDVIVGVDAGGDALAQGHEPGIRSPIADATGVAALATADVPTVLGVYGYGSDGELTQAELDDSLAVVAGEGGLLGAWGLTSRVVAELTDLLADVETEASRLPVEAAGGGLGERSIRGGDRQLRLTAASTVTFYLDPVAVAAVSDPVARIRSANGIEAVNRELRDAGYVTELSIERGEVDAG